MSRSKKKSKPPGWEFWGKRPKKGSDKKVTVRIERTKKLQEVKKLKKQYE